MLCWWSALARPDGWCCSARAGAVRNSRSTSIVAQEGRGASWWTAAASSHFTHLCGATQAARAISSFGVGRSCCSPTRLSASTRRMSCLTSHTPGPIPGSLTPFVEHSIPRCSNLRRKLPIRSAMIRGTSYARAGCSFLAGKQRKALSQQGVLSGAASFAKLRRSDQVSHRRGQLCGAARVEDSAHTSARQHPTALYSRLDR